MRRYFIACVAAGLLLFGRAEAGGVTTIISNGPNDNRVNVVFVGDGYTQADLDAGVYDTHVNDYLGQMFTPTSGALLSEPFARYRNYFNVHVIEVVSNESGADAPPEGVFRDTALDATYYTSGIERLLTINTGKANAVRNAALAGTGIRADMQFATVNETRYGGAGGSWAVFAGGNGAATELALHEVGHSFSDLADEYEGNPGPYAGDEPREVNVTTDPTGAKWAHWIGYDQPGIGVIGAYEGGRYYEQGIYRPSLNSKMRNLGRPFDAVSREKILQDIYRTITPLDSWTLNEAPLVDPVELTVERIDDELIEMEWYVDGVLVQSAVDESFSLRDHGFGPGAYDVTARAYDPTAFDPIDGWVRTQQALFEMTIPWSVTITVPEPSVLPLVSLTVLAFVVRLRNEG